MSHEGLSKPAKVAIGTIAVLTTIIVVVAMFLALGRGTTNPSPSASASAPLPPSSRAFPTLDPLPKAPLPMDDVPKADPLAISIPSLGVQAHINLYTAAMAQASKDPLTGQPCWADDRIACVNPPSYKDVYWLKAGIGQIPFGDQPGTDTIGTVYLIAHASATKAAVFTEIYKLVVGDDIVVTTANGTLHYAVEEVVVLDKADWSTSDYANAQVPGRVILGTCYHGDDAHIGSGGSSKENVIVVAQLSSAQLAK